MVDNPWVPTMQAESHSGWWNYPTDAGVYGQRRYVARDDLTMSACALFTLKGAKGKTGAAGTFFEAKAIDTTDLENIKGWKMLMKGATLTEEESSTSRSPLQCLRWFIPA